MAARHARHGDILFGVGGTIVWARHNCPGSWNDGETSRQLQLKLGSDLTEAVTGLVADSAFPVIKGMNGKTIMPLKDGELDKAPTDARLSMIAISNHVVATGG